MLKTIKKT